MTALDQEQDVVDLAQRLSLGGDPVEAIINFCQKQVDVWVREAGGVETIGELEALIASRLNLVIEEVGNDADLDDLKRRYVQKGEIVFAHVVQNDLTPETFGTMVRLKDGSHVAVIDCRGEKAARRFFTRWHEIAHLLVEPDCEQQVFRASDEPLERLMDQIAGHVGFYDSIFTPLFNTHLSHGELLTFDRIDDIRKAFCPHASFQSTLFACQRRMRTPVLYLEASMAYTEDERRSLRQARMFADDCPEKKLRVRLTLPNKAAGDMKLAARRNMQVPESSVIYAAFHDQLTAATGEENLKTWTFSSGGSLMDCEVFVQARRVEDSVMATVQPRA
ncbi:MAG: hypothetical protein WD049_09190 [Candidatus Paceibacterota bacterium]